MNRLFPAGLWYSQVLLGGQDRHVHLAHELLSFVHSRRNPRGWSHKVLENEAAAASWLLEGLCQAEAHLPAVPLILPQRPAAFTASSRYPVPFGYGVITRLLEGMRALDWVSVEKGRVGSGYTRIRAIGRLLDHARRLQCSWVYRPPRSPETLLLMGKEKRPIEDHENPDVRVWRANLTRINDFLARQAICLRAPDLQLTAFALDIADHNVRKAEEAMRKRGYANRNNPRITPKVVQYGQVSLYRTFSGSFDLGGRFYGGFWQNLPAKLRRYIWINQWQGVEVDYSGMAIRCLYALEKLEVPEDPYDIGLDYTSSNDPRRRIVKKVMNAILNDRDGRYRIQDEEIEALGITRRELDRRVQSLHAGIAHHFHTDAGLRMQLVDAQIAETIMLNLIERGIVVLPIHDSFIVQAPYLEHLEREMCAVFRQMTGAEAKLKAERPAQVRHYTDPVISKEELADTEVLSMHLDFEFQRLSMANEYFFSWMQQNWTEKDLVNAFAELEAAPRGMLQHHAFPLPLLRPEQEEEAEGRGRGGPAGQQRSGRFPAIPFSTSGRGFDSHAPKRCSLLK